MSQVHFKKRAIPNATRLTVARWAGATGPGRYDAECVYCGHPGEIVWMTATWVVFPGLELDHVHPEYLGGTGDPENIVLACRPCNRAKGHKTIEEWLGA